MLTPHIALFLWYLVFLIAIPLAILFFKGFEYLKNYLPIIDLIANIFSTAGGAKSNRLLYDLYSLSPNNLLSFVSTNFINLLALIGVSWNSILFALENNSLQKGVEMSIIMYVVTYLLPTELIGLVGHRFQQWVDQFFNVNYNKKEKQVILEGYLGGVILSALLILIEAYLIQTLVITPN